MQWMEIYRFGDELDLGISLISSWTRRGDILLLSHGWSETSKRWILKSPDAITGEPISKIELKNLPRSFLIPTIAWLTEERTFTGEFIHDDRCSHQRGRSFQRRVWHPSSLELEEKDKEGAMMVGFSVDGDGNILSRFHLFQGLFLTPERKFITLGNPAQPRKI